MKKQVKYIGFGISMLLLLYAFDAMVLGIISPIITPNLNSFVEKLIIAFIAIVSGAAIIYFLNRYEYD